MGYISVKQASTAWGISTRMIQNYCSRGRIQGAIKAGKTWLIPQNSAKPLYERKTIKSSNKKPLYLPYFTFSESLPSPLGKSEEVLNTLKGDEKELFDCELAYMRGNFGKSNELYKKMSKENELYLCTLNLALSEAIALGEYETFEKLYKNLLGLRLEIKHDNITKSVIDMSIFTMMYRLKTSEVEYERPDISNLPRKVLKEIYFLEGYYDLFITKNYSRVVYKIEEIMRKKDKDEYSYLDIFLCLMCSASFEELGQKEKAFYYAQKAIDLAMKDELIFHLSRFSIIFGSTLAECIKERDEILYNKVIKLGKELKNNYISIQSKIEENNENTLLTHDEIQLARLVLLGYTNKKIAEELCCSATTVKRSLETIFCKLSIKKRGEIKNYIL